MAFLIATGTSAPGLKIGGTDISDHVRSIEVQQNYADVDITAMGAVSQQHAPGLRDDRIIVTFFQDFASTKVDALINPLLGSATGATLIAYTSEESGEMEVWLQRSFLCRARPASPAAPRNPWPRGTRSTSQVYAN